jgi:hypothetical protein
VGTAVLFLGIKQPASDADHSPPSTAEVKKVWSYTSTPPQSVDRDKFVFVYVSIHCINIENSQRTIAEKYQSYDAIISEWCSGWHTELGVTRLLDLIHRIVFKKQERMGLYFGNWMCPSSCEEDRNTGP